MSTPQKSVLILVAVFIALISISGIIYLKSKQSSNDKIIVTSPPDNVFLINTPTITPIIHLQNKSLNVRVDKVLIP